MYNDVSMPVHRQHFKQIKCVFRTMQVTQLLLYIKAATKREFGIDKRKKEKEREIREVGREWKKTRCKV